MAVIFHHMLSYHFPKTFTCIQWELTEAPSRSCVTVHPGLFRVGSPTVGIQGSLAYVQP